MAEPRKHKGQRTHTCCIIEGCDRKGQPHRSGVPLFKRGLCATHYNQWLRFGDPLHPFKYSDRRIGTSDHPLYGIWTNIRKRITNPNDKRYHCYGGRGIKMSERWQGPNGFLNFVDDVGERPSPKHSIDRIDNEGHYEPGNVKWSTIHEQSANRRTNNGYLGVFQNKETGNWFASIRVDNVVHNLGTYTDIADAIKARIAGEEEHGIKYSNVTRSKNVLPVHIK